MKHSLDGGLRRGRIEKGPPAASHINRGVKKIHGQQQNLSCWLIQEAADPDGRRLLAEQLKGRERWRSYSIFDHPFPSDALTASNRPKPNSCIIPPYETSQYSMRDGGL